MIEKEKRNEKIYRLRKEGLTFEAISKKFGISKQRVHEINKLIITRKDVRKL